MCSESRVHQMENCQILTYACIRADVFEKYWNGFYQTSFLDVDGASIITETKTWRVTNTDFMSNTCRVRKSVARSEQCKKGENSLRYSNRNMIDDWGDEHSWHGWNICALRRELEVGYSCWQGDIPLYNIDSSWQLRMLIAKKIIYIKEALT